MTKKFQPFADDAQSLSLGDLTIENGTDKVSIYGSIDVTRDKAGLKKARELKVVLDALVRTLSQNKALPAEVPAPETPQQVKNPFA
jgi:hypothetical protein